ncbi:MAG: hypothetical protein CMH57_08020 [Myxococcales bacterium]|nr:hypothetical protein [Myxococcales bacterium]
MHTAPLIPILLTSALLILGGCSDEAPPEVTPEAETSSADLLPETNAVGSPLAIPEELSEALARLGRSSEFTWGHKTTLVPGHLVAWLTIRESKRPVLTVTIDDLINEPERRNRLRAMPARIRKHPAEKVEDNWIRALVAGRFEVVVRAQDKSFYDQSRLDHWFEELRLEKLEKLAQKPAAP